MKKLVASLFFLVVHNACAMELEVVKKPYPLEILRENDEKCKWVARYLYKYPVGQKEKDAEQICEFVRTNPILVMRITTYMTMLRNREAEEMMCCIYGKEFPYEIREIILEKALYNNVALYCAQNSAWDFVDLEAINSSVDNERRASVDCTWHFLSEINGDDKIYIGLLDDKNNPAEKLVHYFLRDTPYEIRKATKEVVSFLEAKAKDERINVFQETLKNQVAFLLHVNQKEAFDEFVDVLRQFEVLIDVRKNLYKERIRRWVLG